MTRRPTAKAVLTSPWLSLGLLLAGLAIGTWAPAIGGPFSRAVEVLVDGLAAAASVIILVSILPSLLALFATGAGRAPLVVLAVFLVTTFVAGLFGLGLAWALFGLPVSGDGGAGFGEAMGRMTGLFGTSAAVFALLWAFGSAILLHLLLVLGRTTRTSGSPPRRALGAACHVATQTVRVFNAIGTRGIAAVGRGLEYVLPLLLFMVGTYVPGAVEDAAELAGRESDAFEPVPFYLFTAVLIGAATLVYAVFIMFVAARWGRVPFRRIAFSYAPPVYGFAWATASSTATIPVNLDAAERLGVSKETRFFVIPLGATVNLDGTMVAAMLLTPAVMYAIGLPLSLGLLAATLVPLLLITAGAPGLPSGVSIIAPPVLAAIVGLDGAQAGAFIGVWFAFSVGLSDQFRSAANSVINGALCIVVERILRPRAAFVLEEIEDAPRGAGRASSAGAAR